MINPIKLIRAFMAVSGLQAKALTEVKMESGANKPGWKTTEFWLTVATQIPVVVGIFLGASNPITLGLGAAATIAYTLGRSWSKGNALAVAKSALEAAAEAAKALPKPEAK